MWKEGKKDSKSTPNGGGEGVSTDGGGEEASPEGGGEGASPDGGGEGASPEGEGEGGKQPKTKREVQRKIPHMTLLPGLQFSLAGILGKPETFYDVPVIRFTFEIFSYL